MIKLPHDLAEIQTKQQPETQPHQPFGKLERNNEGRIVAWHALVDHMLDVAACFKRLAACHAIRRSLERCAKRTLSAQDIERLTVLAFLHDIGKANSGFQAKYWVNIGQIPRSWPVKRHAGHGDEVFDLCSSEVFAVLEPLFVNITDWGAAADSLFIASISHHGRPLTEHKNGKPTPDPTIWDRKTALYEPAQALKEIVACVSNAFPLAFAVSKHQDLPSTPHFAALFAGLVQLADWLGSDTRFFSLTQPKNLRQKTPDELADAAIKTLGLDAEAWRTQLNKVAPDFAHVFSVPAPRSIQAAMSDANLGSLLILESETGSGKTEAALWRFIQLFQAGEVDSLYFALPTRVAASQLYQRVQDTLQRLWPQNPPLALRALSGYVAADGETAKALPGFKVLWSDNPNDQNAAMRWAGENAKRFLAAPVAVGTIDQALLAVLQVRHAHLRQATLARSLLVVDEVHASDAYMGALLKELLKTHTQTGGHALLLSATLGSCARSGYLALTQTSPSPTLSFHDACQIPYPALSDAQKIRALGENNNSKTVHWQTRDCIDSPTEIAQLAFRAAAQGAKVLIIRNTVPAAIKTLLALEALEAQNAQTENQTPNASFLFRLNGVTTLHHSRFSRQDRPLLDAAIEAQLGKKNRTPTPLIVVGTQTLEQSLDIDADYLITDLCPMDVLLQRIGRLHRHDNQRPAAFTLAQALVLTPKDHDLTPLIAKSQHGLGRFHNGGGVYVELDISEATRRLILEKPTITIPADNRFLVEAATHPAQLSALCATLGQDWQTLAEKNTGEIAALKTVANLHIIDPEQAFGDLNFSDDEKISTRLGAQDRLVSFDPPQQGPFGEVSNLPIRRYLLPDLLTSTCTASDIEADANGISFSFEQTRFYYSRLGLEKVTPN